MSKSAWNQGMPIYVTNETASGHIGSFTLNVWLAFTVYMLVLANVIGWSIVGLVELVQYILNAL